MADCPDSGMKSSSSSAHRRTSPRCRGLVFALLVGSCQGLKMAKAADLDEEDLFEADLDGYGDDGLVEGDAYGYADSYGGDAYGDSEMTAEQYREVLMEALGLEGQNLLDEAGQSIDLEALIDQLGIQGMFGGDEDMFGGGDYADAYAGDEETGTVQLVGEHDDADDYDEEWSGAGDL
ncbi:hypothetical protein M885DRAFT_90003 [Pelagophyceae sp. CCMP2097]|nr:hypothetical protein M885DRAFT_90003 [Pelagophyceae sp. CCMP2097]|mmetsp:Transcript_29362/g.98905  ORF Transcript_29362/g.98905 Transcript_29362/m.98905 type:complete len:178 (+) Transcript_29362:125-658(+)